MAFRIEESERVQRAQILFDLHRERYRNLLFPARSVTDITQDILISSWCDDPSVVVQLRQILPFGRVLQPAAVTTLLSENSQSIVKASQDQLLYWHLSSSTDAYNNPVDHIDLWTDETQFWFRIIPHHERELTYLIRHGTKIQYLEHFHLDHASIRLTF